jgi:hypothetical protein
VLKEILTLGEIVRYSDHYVGQGVALFEAAKQKGLEGILAKHRSSAYDERRTREWLKIKITQTVDCVIGGYTDPEGTRQYFGSLVLGLYNEKKKLIHVGQAGTGFDQATLKQISGILEPIETSKNPFAEPVNAKNVHWVKPLRVAEVKFSEWTTKPRRGPAARSGLHGVARVRASGRLHVRRTEVKQWSVTTGSRRRLMQHSPRFLQIVDDARSRIQETNVDEVKRKLDGGEKLVLIDVREESEFAKDNLHGAIHFGKGVIERDVEVRVPIQPHGPLLWRRTARSSGR